jgi:hypothetical protein
MTGDLSHYAGRPLSTRFPDTSLVLETKYGIKAELTADGTEVFEITAANPVPQPSTTQPTEKYHYRVLPDWQTTYLWYDAAHLPDDDPVVDYEVLKERYPQLYPFYLKWVDILERQFAREYGPPGESDESELSEEQRTALAIEGFLISSWLALQDDVAQVEYLRFGASFYLDKNNLEAQFRDFIRNYVIKEEKD